MPLNLPFKAVPIKILSRRFPYNFGNVRQNPLSVISPRLNGLENNNHHRRTLTSTAGNLVNERPCINTSVHKDSCKTHNLMSYIL